MAKRHIILPNRQTALVLSLALAASFVLGLFIEPSLSRANPKASWQGEYFANEKLEGEPVLVLSDPVIDMNWFTAAPYEALPADFFSVRWTTQVEFQDDVYRFRVGADDGIRLFIDNQLVIDQFELGTFRTVTRDVHVPAGVHLLKVEYYENTGFAGVLVDWQPIESPAEVIELVEDSAALGVEEPTAKLPPTGYVVSSRPLVYRWPNANAPQLTQVMPYQSYEVLAASPNGMWQQIKIQPDVTGWIRASHLVVSQPTDVPLQDPREERTPVDGSAITTLVLRDAPFLPPHEDLVIPDSVTLTVEARSKDGRWLYVQYSASESDVVEGWVFAPYVKLASDDLANLPVR